MRPTRPTALALALLVAGCSEGPFIDYPLTAPTAAKPTEQLFTTGQIDICYESRAQFAEAEQLARDTCAAYGLQTILLLDRRYQCRITTPHRATFQCFDPDMTDRLGGYINPFDENRVREWQQRTGGKKGPAVPRQSGAATTLSGRGAGGTAATPPKPAELTPVPPTPRSPAAGDVNPPRPVPAVPELQPPPPPPPPASMGDGFSLPQGSWGDAFDRE